MRNAGGLQRLEGFLHIAPPFEGEAWKMRAPTGEHNLQGGEGEGSRYRLRNVGQLARSNVIVHARDRQFLEQDLALQRLQYASQQANHSRFSTAIRANERAHRGALQHERDTVDDWSAGRVSKVNVTRLEFNHRMGLASARSG